MKSYKKIDVSEQQLEDLVRRHAGTIEDGLGYVDHQKQAAGGPLDVLMVDSGKSLVVAELKVVQDYAESISDFDTKQLRTLFENPHPHKSILMYYFLLLARFLPFVSLNSGLRCH